MFRLMYAVKSLVETSFNQIVNYYTSMFRLMYAIKSLVETSFNHIVNYLLSNKLSILLNNGRVAFIVDEIQGTVRGLGFWPGEGQKM